MRIQPCAAIILTLALTSHAVAQTGDKTAQLRTIEPGYNLLCDAVQTAVWGVTDERWERTRVRPGNINCGMLSVTEAFCSNLACSKKAAIVLLPPVSIADPNADRIIGKYNAGHAIKPSDIVDSFANVERIVFSGRGMMITISVSTEDKDYLQELVQGIKRGFRQPK